MSEENAVDAQHRATALGRLLQWIEPDENPSAVIYATITVGVLLAAESARSETFRQTVVATTLALVLYWLAHAYASNFGARIENSEPWSAARLIHVLLQEAAIVKGATSPLLALLACWAVGTKLQTAVLAALWTAGSTLLVFELAAGLRSRLRPLQLALDTAIGVLFGGAVVALRIVLH